MKVIVQQLRDGKITITSISSETTFERVIASLPEDVTAFVIDSSNLPQDTTFFNAWELDGEEVVINLTKAKEIWKDKLRQARKPVFEKLDIEYIKALENEDNSKAKQIISIKRQLRDITISKELANAKTIEAVKAFWPSVLETDEI